MTLIHGVFDAKENLVQYFILLPFSTTFMEAMKRVETARSCIMDEPKICNMLCIYGEHLC